MLAVYMYCKYAFACVWHDEILCTHDGILQIHADIGHGMMTLTRWHVVYACWYVVDVCWHVGIYVGMLWIYVGMVCAMNAMDLLEMLCLCKIHPIVVGNWHISNTVPKKGWSYVCVCVCMCVC